MGFNLFYRYYCKKRQVLVVQAPSAVGRHWACSPEKTQIKKKEVFLVLSENPKNAVSKVAAKKKVRKALIFFFRRIPEVFLFCTYLAIRLRLADLGGVEPLRKLIIPKLS